MKVVVAGEVPFVGEVGELCFAAGHDTTLFLVEDFIGALESGYLMADLADAEVVIEMHNESAATKHELLVALGNAIPDTALVMTTALPTSTTQAAAWIGNPERVIGFSVIPPLAEGGTVELAQGLLSGVAALERAGAFWQSLGYETMVVADGPGLVRARVLCCLINEAVSALQEGVASAADIDKAMQLGTNYPRGPLAWADLIGVDAVLGVMTGLFAEWGEDRYRPAPLLKRMVIAGKLGQKSGEGFYTYPDEAA